MYMVENARYVSSRSWQDFSDGIFYQLVDVGVRTRSAGLDWRRLACWKQAWAAPRSGKRVNEISRPVTSVTGQTSQSRLYDPHKVRAAG